MPAVTGPPSQVHDACCSLAFNVQSSLYSPEEWRSCWCPEAVCDERPWGGKQLLIYGGHLVPENSATAPPALTWARRTLIKTSADEQPPGAETRQNMAPYCSASTCTQLDWRERDTALPSSPPGGQEGGAEERQASSLLSPPGERDL